MTSNNIWYINPEEPKKAICFVYIRYRRDGRTTYRCYGTKAARPTWRQHAKRTEGHIYVDELGTFCPRTGKSIELFRPNYEFARLVNKTAFMKHMDERSREKQQPMKKAILAARKNLKECENNLLRERKEIQKMKIKFKEYTTPKVNKKKIRIIL